MADLPKLEGRISVRTATAVGTFAGFAITMPVGEYYLNSIGSGGATRTFLLELKNQLDTATGRVWTITLDDTNNTSTGKVTISCTGAATTATWDAGNVVRDLLGFNAGLSSGTTWTGANQAKYLWLPNVGRSGIMSPQASTGAVETDYSLSLAPDGTPYALAYSTRSHDSMEFRTVLGSKMWTVKESTVNEAFETFFRSVIAIGMRFRFHADRNVDGTYRTWICESANLEPTTVREDWADGANSLWTVRYSVRETT